MILKHADAIQVAAFYNQAQGCVADAAKLAEIAPRTFWDRVKRARDLKPELFKEFSRDRAEKLKAATVEELVTEKRRDDSARAAQAKLKDALKLITGLEDKIKDLEWSASASLKPAEWSLPKHAHHKREHIPVLLTSDFQLGEVIDPAETETGYGYNKDIFVKRYRRLLDTTIYLSFEHAGGQWKYPGIIYERGGDTISGGIHDELRETDDLTPIQAVELAYEEEAAGIEKLAEAFGRVDVKSPGAGGNHDRNTLKPRAKGAANHSYDRLICTMLRKQFAKDARVHFQTSMSFDVFFPVYNLNVLLTHGDRLGSRGGTGFIGPIATILRGVQKTIQEQAALDRHVHMVDHGHFHCCCYTPFSNSNGCMPGYSEFEKSFRMRPEPPTQLLRYHHAKRGIVDYKPIVLLETP